MPAVTSISTFAFNRHVLAFGMTHGVKPKSVRLVLSKMRHMAKALLLQRRLGRRYGVRGPGLMGSMFGWSALNIVYTSRHFQPCGATFDDPGAYTKPFTVRWDIPWNAPGELTEYICQENNKYLQRLTDDYGQPLFGSKKP